MASNPVIHAVGRALAVGVFAAVALSAVPATAGPVLGEFVVFGNTTVTTGSNVAFHGGASVGSNNTVYLGSNTELDGGVHSGGGFGAGSKVKVSGGLVAGGDVYLESGSVVGGGVQSGGKVGTGTKVNVGQNVVSTGNVYFANHTSVGGNVHSGGDIGIANHAEVAGNATAVGNVDMQKHGKAGAVTMGAEAPVPVAYQAMSLPGANSFTGGGEHQWVAGHGTLELPAGVYGELSTGSHAAVTLTSGEYVFDSFYLGSHTTLNLDFTDGAIVVNIVGSLTTGSHVNVNLVGGDPFDALFEVHGNAHLGSGTDWQGTIFAPTGGTTISTGSNVTITGALYGDTVHLGSGTTISHAPGNLLFAGVGLAGSDSGSNPSRILAPPVLAVTGLGLLALGFAWHRRR